MSYRTRLILSAVALTGCVACAKGADTMGEDDGGGSPPVVTFEGFDFRRVIKLSPSTPADYSIPVVVDHAALVASGQARPDGQDLRVVYEDETGAVELDRVLDTATAWNTPRTVIWFRTRGTQEQGTHFIYYGSGMPGKVLGDHDLVFDDYEGFDGVEQPPEWQFHEVGMDAAGSVSFGNGVANVNGASGDIELMADSFVFFAREISGDFVLDVSIKNISGSLGAGAKTGGLMARQSSLEDSRFAMVGLADAPRQRFTAQRSIEGAAADVSAIDIPESFPQNFSLQKIGTTFTATASDDAINWISLGGPVVVEMIDPMLVGFPLANRSAGMGRIEIDYIRMRTAVLPTPSTELGAEEEL